MRRGYVLTAHIVSNPRSTLYLHFSTPRLTTPFSTTSLTILTHSHQIRLRSLHPQQHLPRRLRPLLRLLVHRPRQRRLQREPPEARANGAPRVRHRRRRAAQHAARDTLSSFILRRLRREQDLGSLALVPQQRFDPRRRVPRCG